jgi:hypothetical protein
VLTGATVTATGVAGAPRRCSADGGLDNARCLSAKGLRLIAGRHGACEPPPSCDASHSSRPNVTTDLLTSLPVPRSTVVWVKLPDGAVLFTPENEVYYSMNAVATVIWEFLSQVADMDALCSLVHRCFPDAELEQMRADVVALLDELARAGLVDCPGRESAA